MEMCSQACSDERMTATASAASFWVALEQPGPWGKKAFVESHLDPAIGERFEQACKAHGGRALLIRGVDGHADEVATAGPRTVLISGGPTDAPWLLRGQIESPAQVLDLPWETFTGPQPQIPGFAPAEPVLLVCTNGKRDRCCSVFARPVVTQLFMTHPTQTWEATHLSGHRFAVTALVLPTMQMLGRMDAELGRDALAAAARGEVVVDEAHDRGRGCFPPPVQAAETFVRVERGIAAIDGLTLHPIDETTVVAEVDGQRLRLTLGTRPLPPQSASCGIEPKVRHSWGVLRCEKAE